MTEAQRAWHPAPWPLLDLDVAKIRAAGNQAAPFRQFILKVHSRCNLSCSYCYVYEMADQGWRGLPKRMSPAVAVKAVERIAEHAGQHGLASVDVILHGGEPLLAGAEWLAGLVGSLRARVPAEVNVGLQTNGTLLDRPMLTTLKSLGIRIGVSLDGDAEATGRHRRYANGRNSFDAVADGLDLLQSPEFRDCYGGILCTIDVQNDPVSTYEALLKFAPPALDLLLPHANWSSAPPGDGYADWLISVFERWYTAPRQETRIRLFSELIQLVLGQPGEVEGLGLLPSTLVVVDTDGSVKQLDSLSSTYPGAADIGLDVMSGSFDDALDHPTTVARQIGADALSAGVPGLPGDGYLRRRPVPAPVQGRGRLPAPLRLLPGPARAHHPRARPGPRRTCPRLLDLQVIRFDFRGQPGSLRRRPCLGCSRVSVRSYLLSTSARRRSPAGLVPGGRLVTGQVGRRHQRVRVIIAQVQAAVGERLLAEPDRLAEAAATRRGRRRS